MLSASANKRSVVSAAARLATGLCLVLALGCDQNSALSSPAPLELDVDELVDRQAASGKTRAEYVAEADALALSASKAAADKAPDLYRKAAQLRRDAFVAFGKKVDALEALELLNHRPLGEEEDCNSSLFALELEVALGKDPAAQYRDLFLLREQIKDPACRSRLDRAMVPLNAFKPSAEELTELRDNVRLLHKEEEEQAHVHDASEHVVIPEVLKATLDQPTEITKVEPFVAERTARVVVHVTHPTRFRVGTLAASDGYGPRLFVDIDHANFKGLSNLESEGLLKRVRLGKSSSGARVVLDLNHPTFHRVFYLPEPFRLVIDLSLDAPEQAANLRKIQRVVLDPGHGGHDPGAVGPNGLQEKDVALDIAHRAAPLLAREVGVSTLLTRDVDVFVPLDERAARANAFNADLFVSIHLNSNPDSASRGVMTFVLDASRDAAASKVAARENSSTEAAAVELANSLSRIDNTARREASETFASLLQRSAGASLRQKYDDVLDSGVRRAGFYVLAGAVMPAVLFEGSFISNPVEADRLNQKDYRQRLADAIVNAVRAYRQGM